LRAGFGIAGTQAGIAAREKDLVPVLPDQVRFALEMWLAMHEDLKMNRRVRLLFDHLVRGLSDYVAVRPGR
jgi:DNA-binding transcriptional LysR family regulator